MKILTPDTQPGSDLHSRLSAFRPEWRLGIHDTRPAKEVLLNWLNTFLTNDAQVTIYILDEGVWSDYEPTWMTGIDWKAGFACSLETVADRALAYEGLDWSLDHGWFLFCWFDRVRVEVNHDRIVRVEGVQKGDLQEHLGNAISLLQKEVTMGSELTG